ncbi:MAG: undecaprenyl/decaprenyl-phosphate alpha-N-acetylglucosaminyl 1-phosphate transferase [Flavobacteriaceae bacterium]|nr:undecaprenyl/decaprenyl-phosphate alpha-N-acetylglucosaminyl 1-phosphate transferase [Flavobacteriaceae bacterium]
MLELFYYFLFFFFSIAISYYLNGYVFNAFSSNRMLDPINERSSHISPATRTGGLSLFLSLSLCYAIAASVGLLKVPGAAVVAGVIFITLAGFVDDLISIRYREKFFLQLFSGLLIVQSGWMIDSFHGVFGIFDIPEWAGILVSLFVFLVIVNALNLIDGLDGLASFVAIKFFLLMGGLILISFKELFLFFPIIVGCLVGFLGHNFRASPKVFLGDTGSLLLGSIIAFFLLYMLGSNTSIITDSFISRPLLAVLLIFYPLVDTLRAILLRSYKRKSPFVADRIHLHHRLVDKGYEHWAASLLILCLSLFLLVLNCLLYLKLGLMLCVVMTVAACLILYYLFFK